MLIFKIFNSFGDKQIFSQSILSSILFCLNALAVMRSL